MKGRKIIIGLIIIICLIAIIVGFIYKRNIDKERSFYATVNEVKDGYILINPQKGETISNKTKRIIIYTKDKYQIEDNILVYYKGEVTETDPSTINVIKIETISTKNIIQKESEEEIEEPREEINSEEKVSTTTNENKNEEQDSQSSNSNNNQDNSSNTKEEYTEEDVINYFNEKLEEVSNYKNTSEYKTKAKELFTTLVDFLFYNGEIKGYTFSELSDTAKLKVLNITFKIDSKIEEKFPNYKEELSDKYHNAKDMIAVKYLEYTTKICSNHESYCETAKNTWSTIKEKASISWQTIKKYASNGISNIKEWYEVYSGKTN